MSISKSLLGRPDRSWSIRLTLGRLGIVAIAAAALAGCGGDKNNVNDTAHAANVQQSISAVQNNSHIPDQAKAQIIATMQQGAPGAAQH